MSLIQRLAIFVVTVLLVTGSVFTYMWWHDSDDASPQKPLSLVAANRLYRDAMSKAEQGSSDESIEILRSLLEQREDHSNAKMLLGQLLWDQQDEEAFELWNQIPSGDKQRFGLSRYLMGRALLDQGKAAAAEQSLLEAQEVLPQHQQTIDALLDLYCVQRRATSIRTQLARRSQIGPLAPSHLAIDLLAGKSVFPVEQETSVLTNFTSVETSEDRGWAAIALSSVYRSQGKLKEALDCLPPRDSANDPQTAVADTPGAVASRHSMLAARIMVLVDRGAAYEAVPDVRELLSLTTIESDSAAALGRWFFATGQPESAFPLLRKAAQESPLDGSVWILAGQAAAQTNRSNVDRRIFEYSEALDELEQQAYLILRGTSDRNLLATTMDDIAEQLAELRQPQRADLWAATADLIRNGPQARSRPTALPVNLQVAAFPDAEESDGAQSPEIWTESFRKKLVTVIDSLDQGTAVLNRSVSGERQPEFRFQNVAQSAGLDFVYDPGNTQQQLIVETIGGGVCVLDFDLDGLPDLFFPQGGRSALTAAMEGSGVDDGQPSPHDRLFRNTGQGTFEDVSATAGIKGGTYGLGCAAADLDNDGDPDLVVGAIGSVVVYFNQSDGTFVREVLRQGPELVTTGIGVGEFNGDGSLDLFLVNYVDDWQRTCRNAAGEFSTCLPSVYDPLPDIMLTANGRGEFDVAELPATVADGRGLGIVTLDLNADGLSEIYVANDGSPNHLYDSQPDGPSRYRERAFEVGVAVSDQGRSEAGMGIAVADFDHNQAADFVVTNFHQESNRLYLESGGGLFRDTSAPWRLTEASLPLLSFGVQSADFNSDGYPDLLIANGHISDYSSEGIPYQMRPQLLGNVAGKEFKAVADAAAYFDERFLGRAVALLDSDGDLRVDACVVHQNDDVALLRNAADASAALRVRLIGTASNRDAINATVDVVSGEVRHRYWVQGSHGYMATNERCLFVPRGAEPIDRLEIRWPGGQIQTVDVPQVASSLTVIEDGRVVIDPEAVPARSASEFLHR